MYILLVAGGFPQKRYPLNGIFEFDQAKALAAVGHKVVFAAIDLRSIHRWRKWGYERFDRDIPVGAVPKPWLDTIGKITFKHLYSRIEAEFGKPDIVHAHFFEVSLMVADFCKKEKLPLAITEHSSNINTLRATKNDIERAKRAYSVADKIIAVSNALKEMIKFHTGIEVLVVPNVVDLKAFTSYTSTKRSDREINKFLFVATGNLILSKGFDLLIDSFFDVVMTYPNTFLYIFGDGPMHNELVLQVKSLRIEKNITFMGRRPREELAKVYSIANAFVLPSLSETFGVAYIEAMVSGLPVIATQCGGPEDFVTPQTGLLIPINNRKALTDAMIYMINHRLEYHGEIISTYALNRFSPENVASQLTEIYNNIVKTTLKNKNVI